MMQREVENRIVWACFVIDGLAANGVEKNMCWKDNVPNIPLPCSDACFNTSQLSLIPHYLSQIEDSAMHTVIADLDLAALLVVVVRLRTKVMQ